MNFKRIGLNVAMAATVAAGAAMTAEPVQAGGLKGYDLYSVTLNFRGNASFNETSAFLDFEDEEAKIAKVTNPRQRDIDAFGSAGKKFSIADLQLTPIAGTTDTWTLSAPKDNFLTGLENGISFRLDTFSLIREKVEGGLRFYNASLTGTFFSSRFSDGVETKAGNIFQTQIGIDGDGNYVGAVSTIPTPGLLPGLLGLGAAALRRRKGEESEETAEA
jgi:MYXO-CTERM domain-containing protein